MSTPQPIVAAALVDSLANPTLFYAASRAYPAELRGQYEFPGGKMENNETPQAALEREIYEELRVHIRIGAEVTQPNGSWWPLANGRLMGVWLAEVTRGNLTLGGGHLEGRWLPFDHNALSLPWIAADLPIVETLITTYAPSLNASEY